MLKEIQDKLHSLLRASASENTQVRHNAMSEFTALAEAPIREGVFDGPVVLDMVFEKIPVPEDSSPKFPVHFVAPGTEGDYKAYTVPKCGAIPYRMIAGDEQMVNTYRIGNSIDACQNYIRNARWDVVEDMFKVYQDGYTMKLNDDGLHALMAAAVGRAITVQDGAAAAGSFTFKLLSNMITRMKRNGGNSTSVKGYKLTDVMISPEAMGDLRNLNIDNWTIDRFNVVQNQGTVYNLFGVNLHEIYELGPTGSLNDYAVDVLNYPLTGSDTQYVIGMDLTKRRTFVMPVHKEVSVKEDLFLDRAGRWGIYGDMFVGFGVLDDRNVILGSA